MNIIKYRKIYYGFSILLVLGSIIALSTWGLKWGIDFKGGSVLEVSYTNGRPSTEEIKKALESLKIGETVRTVGENGVIISAKELTDAQKNSVTEALRIGGTKAFTEQMFNAVGPTLGNEAKKKAYVSIFFVILAIVLFITYAFRRVSRPVASWKYGIAAIVALCHDVIIPTGFFSLMGHFYGYEVDTLFVTALLVILGFSVHDTIVVFDRVRENLHKNGAEKVKKSFDEIVNMGINQTFVRSINTSLTTLLSLVALYIWGPESTRHFSVALFVGITMGTYSSIFLGSTLLVSMFKWQENRRLVGKK